MTDTPPLVPRAALIAIVAGAVVGLIAGRSMSPGSSLEERDRVERVLKDSLDRQAELNKSILDQNRQVAEASRKLVEADAKARAELVALNRDIQSERMALVRMQEAIETERRELAQERHREPIVAAAIETIGLLIATASVVLLCAYIVRRLGPVNDQGALAEVIVRDITSDRPILLPPAPPAAALPRKPARELPDVASHGGRPSSRS